MGQRKKVKQARTGRQVTEPGQWPITTIGLTQCKVLEN
jgi:hypothetical protein